MQIKLFLKILQYYFCNKLIFSIVGRLMDMHGETGSSVAQPTSGDAGQVVDRPDGYEPPIQKTV